MQRKSTKNIFLNSKKLGSNPQLFTKYKLLKIKIMKLEKVFYNTAKIMVVVVFNQFFNQYIVFTQNQTNGNKKILKAFDEMQAAFDYAGKANNKIELANINMFDYEYQN